MPTGSLYLLYPIYADLSEDVGDHVFFFALKRLLILGTRSGRDGREIVLVLVSALRLNVRLTVGAPSFDP